MTSQDWTSDDTDTDLWRKVVRNLGAWADTVTPSSGQDWSSDDNHTDLMRKAVANSNDLT